MDNTRMNENNEAKVNWGTVLTVFGVKNWDDVKKIVCPVCGKQMKPTYNKAAMEALSLQEVTEMTGNEFISMFVCPDCGKPEGPATISIERRTI